MSKEEAHRDEAEDWEFVLIVVATAVESAFFFSMLFGHRLVEKVSEKQKGNKKN